MRKFSIVTGALAALACAGVGLAGTAAANGNSALDTVNSLEDQGYQVHINYPRSPYLSLSQCIVTGESGVPRGVTDQEIAHNTTVYVDISCASGGGD